MHARVVAFSGHMIDRPGSVRRFPEAVAIRVGQRIEAALRALDVELVGVSSAADGGDLLFIESVIRLGGRAELVLPFAVEAFEQTSVAPAWRPRFHAALADPHAELQPVLVTPSPSTVDGRREAYERCNRAIVERARLLAGQLSVPPLLLVVLHRSVRDGKPGGAQELADAWTGPIIEIDPLQR